MEAIRPGGHQTWRPLEIDDEEKQFHSNLIVEVIFYQCGGVESRYNDDEDIVSPKLKNLEERRRRYMESQKAKLQEYQINRA